MSWKRGGKLDIKKIVVAGLYQSLGLVVYCVLITFIMDSIFGFFGKSPAGPDQYYFIMFLMVFVVSALITGSIILVYPIILAINKKFKKAGLVILSTVLWSILFIIITMVVAMLISLP